MRTELLFLQDIMDAAEVIRTCLAGVSKAEFLEDQNLQGNVAFRLLIIGEAAAKVSDALRERHPEVEWARVKALRNIFAHSYFGVKWDLV